MKEKMNQSVDVNYFKRTLNAYDFTYKAEKAIREMISSDAFQDMSAENTLNVLLSEMNKVPFHDYLKRYLYKQAEMTESFRSIPDNIWISILEDAFEENSAPHSFEPTSTKWHATIKSWLKADRVKRDTVFLLGFGLRMSAKDVSEMLTKAINEEDFDWNNPRELIFHFCYEKELPYSYAHQLLQKLDEMQENVSDVSIKTEVLPHTEEELLLRLRQLKAVRNTESLNSRCRQCFLELYERCRKRVAEIYRSEEEEKSEKDRRTWSAEDITASDMERMLCSGVPHNEAGNLIKADRSVLHQHFESFRPSRQHLDGILRGKLQPDRYDLITLMFFLHSENEKMEECERFKRFVTETNQVLASCRMRYLYPAHPYEAFIMVCMLSPCPLTHYGDVIEMSYA